MGEATNASAVAEDDPIKPVRLIEPFGAGGGPDLLARALAQQLSQLWGQPVTVENIPGAGATAGPAQVAKSPPDGYTLLINTNAQAYSAAFSKNLPYDPLKDFIPIAPLTSQPYVLVAGKPAGIATVGELIALGVSTAWRSALLPEVPTIAEAGVAGFDFPIWYGLWAPAGTPAGVIEKLVKDIGRVLAGQSLRDWVTKHGGEPMNMTQPEFARFVLSESESAAQIIKAAGIKSQ